MTFMPCQQQNLGKRRPFRLDALRGVAPARVESGVWLEEDGQLFTDYATRLEEPTDALLREQRRILDEYRGPTQVTALHKAVDAASTALHAEAEPFLARLASVINTEANAAVPEPEFVENQDGKRTIALEQRDLLNRQLDQLLTLPVNRQRDVVVEQARKGNNQPYLALKYLAPAMVSQEVLGHDRVDRLLRETWLASSSERKRRHDSASAVLALGQMALESALSYVEEVRPKGDTGSIGQNLLTGEGRQVPRYSSPEPGRRSEGLLRVNPDGSVSEIPRLE